MKFNFDFESHRKNLADKLRETRKTDKYEAISILESEQRTDAYNVSKEAKKINHNETTTEQGKKYYEKINSERLQNLEELGYEVVDISNQIPEDIKLYIDESRIAKTKKEGSKIKYEKEISLLIDKLSDGKYLDKRHANHVVGAWHGAEFYEPTFDIKEELSFDDNNQKFLWVNFGKSNWADRQPGKPLVIMSVENPRFKKLMETNWESMSSSLFHTSEGNPANISKPKEFEEMLSTIRKKDDLGKEYYLINTDTNEEKLLPYMVLNELPVENEHGDTTGVKLKNLKSNASYLNMPLRWAEIADTIIDLSQGKMYRYKSSAENT